MNWMQKMEITGLYFLQHFASLLATFPHFRHSTNVQLTQLKMYYQFRIICNFLDSSNKVARCIYFLVFNRVNFYLFPIILFFIWKRTNQQSVKVFLSFFYSFNQCYFHTISKTVLLHLKNIFCILTFFEQKLTI